MIDWLKTHWRPLGMMVLILTGYIVKKVAPLAADELALLDAIWAILGFGAVLTPNFSQHKASE